MTTGVSLAIGIALGVVFGTALDNVAIGIALGVVFGLAGEGWFKRQSQDDSAADDDGSKGSA